jgi:hypothetical protein
MRVDQILEQEIKDSELWLSRTHEDSTSKIIWSSFIPVFYD